MKTFASRLRQTRRAKRLNQSELAEMIGITTRSVQNYESGSRMPNSMEITEKLARALDVTAAYLLGEEDETTPVPLLGEIACGPFNFGDFFVNLIKKSLTIRFWQNGKIHPYFLRCSAGSL